jgi:hypothetical protein
MKIMPNAFLFAPQDVKRLVVWHNVGANIHPFGVWDVNPQGVWHNNQASSEITVSF